MSEAVRATIYVSATGISRCAGIEMPASIAIVPSYGGFGFALPLDLTVAAEACKYCVPGSLGESEVEVRVEGGGVEWSSLGVAEAAAIAARLHLDGSLALASDVAAELAKVYGYAPVAAAAASLLSSPTITLPDMMFIDVYEDFSGAWMVVCKPILAPEVVGDAGRVAEQWWAIEAATARLLDDALSGFEALAELIPALAGSAKSPLRGAREAGAEVATVTADGAFLVALTWEEHEAERVAEAWRRLGKTVYAPIPS